MKKILATLVTAVVIGAGGMAVASAADSPKTTTAPSTVTAPAKPKAAVDGVLGLRARKFAFETAAKTIGISPAELLKEMQGGHTVAAVATAHHIDPQTVVNAIVSGADAKIQQAVTSGKISSATGAKLQQWVATAAPKFVNATLQQLAHTTLVAEAVDVSAKTIGVTPQVLRQALVSGQSVAQVATAHNVSPTTVVNALVAAGNARIDTAVANHHLSAARAAALKARLPKVAQRFVDAVHNGTKKPAAAA